MKPLVLGNKTNPNIGHLHRRCIKEGADVSFLYLDKGFEGELVLEGNNLYMDGTLTIPPTKLFSYFYFNPDEYTKEETREIESLRTIIESWCVLNGTDIIEPSTPISKILLLHLAYSCGFNIPPTLVSNRNVTPNGFIEKPVNGGSWTTLAGEGDFRGGRFFQERLTGREMRLYIVDDEYIPLVLKSEHIDYREHNDITLSLIDLPESLTEPLGRFREAGRIEWGNIDLKEGEDGEWYFLEYNRWPFFVRQDLDSNGAITQSLITYLLKSKERRCE